VVSVVAFHSRKVSHMLWSIFILFFYFKKKTNFNFWVCLLYILVLVWLFLLCKIKKKDKIVRVVKWMGMIRVWLHHHHHNQTSPRICILFCGFQIYYHYYFNKAYKKISFPFTPYIFLSFSLTLTTTLSQTQILNYLLFKIKN
jgi:sensor histidine kinase YesM